MTSVDATVLLWDWAAQYGQSGATTADDVSSVLVGANGIFTLVGGLGAAFNKSVPSLGDSGFNADYRDGQNQPFHFWAYVNTVAQGGLGGLYIGQTANNFHEMWDPMEAVKPIWGLPRGTSWEDYALAVKGLQMGYLLHTGELPVNQAGSWMQRELAEPAGWLYDVGKASGVYWWPSTWMQAGVDLLWWWQ